jgi:single-strand DNA-binding protein
VDIMLITNLCGRLGNDPVARTTKSGTAMNNTGVAVDLSGKDAEPQTLWVNLLWFGYQIETLLRASKGEMLSAVGRMSRGEYTAKTGEIREQWTCIAESIIVAKSARPSGRPRAGADPWGDRQDCRGNTNTRGSRQWR